MQSCEKFVILSLKLHPILMATDPLLLDRIQLIMKAKGIHWIEKKMFGGHCFMVDDKMCFGTYKGGLMARVGPDVLPELMTREGAEQMVNAGRIMKGYLFIEPEGYDTDDDLEFWIDRCLDFNPQAKASKKKKKK